jgi:hypothetical protein
MKIFLAWVKENIIFNKNCTFQLDRKLNFYHWSLQIEI